MSHLHPSICREEYPPHLSIHRLLEDAVKQAPEAPAILAPSRAFLTYNRLFDQIKHTLQTLNELGLGRNDRIAIVLPDGPELAVAFFAVAAGATCAPLNPTYTANEFDFYLSDLKAKALVIGAGMNSPALSVARSRGIPIIELTPSHASEAGVFTLRGDKRSSAATQGFSNPEDEALVLHTSGTTSRPKIVPLTQSNLCTSAHNIRMTLNLTREDRCLNVMPLFHIHGLIGASLSSLFAGACVVCTPGFYAPNFLEWLDEFRPTWYTAVPTMHEAILARAAQHREVVARSKLRLIRSSSSALPPHTMAELERVFGVPVIESYGMTEASHQMTSNPLPPGQRKPGSVGLAAGPEVAIMDDRGELLAQGETGEIVIRGANVTRGYENNPAANEGAFTKGWFRTGDQGRTDADGYLFITGRKKEIINRGGEKIAPREIDEVLLEHPAVAQAVTFSLPDEKLGEDVAAAIVLRDNSSVTDVELREFVAKRLAHFKVPRRVVFLKEIPKGPTGKPQRIGLAEKLGLTQSRLQKAKETCLFSAPRTRTETLLADIWREVLRLETVGIHDDFFLLGGDSILAAQIISRIRDTLNAELSMVRLFELPTVAKLAEWLDSANHSEVQSKVPAIRPFPRTGETPLSFAQERMWFLAQYEEDNTAYARTAAFRLKGVLNVEAFQQSLAKIVERHEVLRTTFHSRDGLPVQIVSEACPVPVRHQDLSDLDESERMRRFLQLSREEVRRPFDLSRDLMLRSTLFKLGGQDYVLLLTMHHIASDGWSQGVLRDELSEFYNGYCAGLPPKLPELCIQYADFAIWQRGGFQGQTLAQDLTYWKEQLSGAPAILRLPTDHPRPEVQTYRGARQSLALSKALTEALKELSRQERVTLFMTLLAGFNALLFRYSGQEDICVGTPVANRNRAETEGLIGFFVNTLALRTNLSGDPSFRELLRRVRELALGAYAHQDLPFEKLVDMLKPERNLSYSAVFQVMFNLRNLHVEVPRLGDLKVEEIDYDPGSTQYDLMFEVVERPEGLSCLAIYSTDLFEAETVRRLLGHYQTFLEGAVNNPDSHLSTLPILTEPERRQLLEEWNQAQKDYPQKCIHELFEEQAARTPEAIAVWFQGQQLTYGELNEKANQLARHLVSLGLRTEDRVGICMRRSPEVVVALLAVLKAGVTFLTLDPSSPRARLAFMIEDAQASLILTERRLQELVPECAAEVICVDALPVAPDGKSSAPNRRSTPDDAAYIMYTSGSTGKPKGARINHRGVVNNLNYLIETYHLGAADTVLQLAALSFEPCIREIFAPLSVGGRLVLVEESEARDPDFLLSVMREQQVTCLLAVVPTMLNALTSAASQASAGLPSLRLMLVSGEKFLRADWASAVEALGRHVLLVNQYGPTECTMTSTYYRIENPPFLTTIPIGRPIPNAEIYILDRDLNPVPVGVTGEIHIGGVGLARGYVNQPDLTSKKFIPHPFSQQTGARLYKTGDLARYLPDGNIEFLGRYDRQVKIRGFRVELEEIEQVLAQHPGVKAAAVVAAEDPAGERQLLVGYAIPRPGQAPTAEGLRTYLGQYLPEHMVPSRFAFMAAFPLTPHGKVDIRSLPLLDWPKDSKTWEYAPPRTELEKALAAIFAEVLHMKQVGATDDFFELGGHSLLAMQAVSRMNRELKVRLKIRKFFEAPTVRSMAQIVTQAWKQGEQSENSVPPEDHASK
jgi:amino acid adenylation domain-containing protein